MNARTGHMTGSKRKRILELADSLAMANYRFNKSKNMLSIVISDAARDVIVEALRAYAALSPTAADKESP